MLGRLTLSSIPYTNPIEIGAVGIMVLVGLIVVGVITYRRKWTYFWSEWLTSVDHKRIGVMYVVVGLVMLLRGFSDAILMRSQQAVAS